MLHCAAIRPNNNSNSHQLAHTVHRFRLIASCINSYDDLRNSFCHHGEVGLIPTVLNHSLNVWAYSDKVLLQSVLSAVLGLSINY